MLERRRFPRTQVFKSAMLISPSRLTVNCTLSNLSNHGACLQLQSPFDLTAEFDLSFDAGRTLRKCRSVWQTSTNVGVSFEHPVVG
jgi:hypothetical protein